MSKALENIKENSYSCRDVKDKGTLSTNLCQ